MSWQDHTADGTRWFPGPLPPNYHLAADEALVEVVEARERFGPMASSHEGYAVLFEEVDELWDEVRRSKHDMTAYRLAMRAEAIQVAAMALCFIVEVCDREEAS